MLKKILTFKLAHFRHENIIHAEDVPKYKKRLIFMQIFHKLLT